jgi:hypothetical protein
LIVIAIKLAYETADASSVELVDLIKEVGQLRRGKIIIIDGEIVTSIIIIKIFP